MKLLNLLLILGCFMVMARTQNVSLVNERNLPIICSRGLPILKFLREMELYCCDLQIHAVTLNWYYGGHYLSRHLELLKTWRCPQLKKECRERPYDFTEFTSLTYDLYCNKSVAEEKCANVLKPMIARFQNESSDEKPAKNDSEEQSGGGESPDSTWDIFTRETDFSQIKMKDLVKPCVQVAQQDSPKGQFGEYYEILSTNLPFCSITWCGFSTSVLQREGGIRAYDCLPTVCKANLIIMMVIVIVLALAIVIANVIVITVFTTTAKLKNSQAIYKISLAFADLLVGLIVLPTFIVTFSKMALEPKEVGEVLTLERPDFANQFLDWNQAPMPGRDGVTIRLTSGRSINTFNKAYRYSIGSITLISFMVSIYSLTLAGIDRLLAISLPLHYRKHDGKKIAIRLCVGVWIVAILLSLLPLIKKIKLQYGLISSMIFAVYGRRAFILYVVVFLVPMVYVWVSNIAIYIMVKRQKKTRMALATNNLNIAAERDTEQRLAVTLCIIVGIFTVCALPATVIALIPETSDRGLDATKIKKFNPVADVAMNSADFVAAMILVSNSLWNCFIYSVRNKDFKKATKALWLKIRRSFKLIRDKKTSDRMRRNRGAGTGTMHSTAVFSSTNSANKNSNCSVQTQESISSDLEESEKPEPRFSRASSIFQSFKLNINADGFFRSVMKRLQLGSVDAESDDGRSTSSAHEDNVKPSRSRFTSDDKLQSISETPNEGDDDCENVFEEDSQA